MPLGVPWWRFSTSKTSGFSVSLSTGCPTTAATVRIMAAAKAAPLPSPLAMGMVERTVSIISGSGECRASSATWIG